MSQTLETVHGEFVIALCGPSGVGKGFVKRKILEQIEPGIVMEPVVVSTRDRRPDDGPDRLVGLAEEDFMERVDAGSVVLPHRPFRHPDTPLYAFDADSLRAGRLLTEVHTSIISEFRALFSEETPMLILGMTAAKHLLEGGIARRQGNFDDGTSAEHRVASATIEESEMLRALASGHLSGMYDCAELGRERAQHLVIDQAEQFILEHL